MPPLFHADQFVPTKWDAAEQKARFANQFVRFVEGGFQPKDFPKWFYNRLSNTFGHIAHYDQGEFYQTFFTNPKDQLTFLEITRDYPCYGNPTFTYSDVEKVLQQWLAGSGFVEKIQNEIAFETVTAACATLNQLATKYGYTSPGIKKE